MTRSRIADSSSPTASEAKAGGTHHFHLEPEKHLPLQLLKFCDVMIARVYHKLDVLSPPQLPAKGPVILICNHTSGLDPLLIQAPLKRIVVWMMAKEYYELKPLKPIFKTLEIIPVDRSARDSSSMRLALRALQDGRVLGVFPEGRIETKRELLPFQPGVAQMAIKEGVPVCPAFLDGTQHGIGEMVPVFAHRQVATIRFGPPVILDKKSGIEAGTTQLREAVWRLRTARFAQAEIK